MFLKIISFITSVIGAVKAYGRWSREKELTNARAEIDHKIVDTRSQMESARAELLSIKAKVETDRLAAELTDPKKIEEYWNKK